MAMSLLYRTKIINKECNLVAFGIFFQKILVLRQSARFVGTKNHTNTKHVLMHLFAINRQKNTRTYFMNTNVTNQHGK